MANCTPAFKGSAHISLDRASPTVSLSSRRQSGATPGVPTRREQIPIAMMSHTLHLPCLNEGEELPFDQPQFYDFP